MRPPSVLLALLSLLIAGPLSADTLYVDAAGNTPYVEIQDAIDASSSGDVILVFPGTYAPIVLGPWPVTVRSIGGPSLTVIDASTTGGPAVLIEEAPSLQLLLHGFTLTGGDGLYAESIVQIAGGGLLVRRNSQGRVSGNVITGNSAEIGGGVAILDSAPFLYGNTIVDNESTGPGGGIWVHSPSYGLEIPLACNDVLDNVGGGVGGMYVGDAEIVATNLVFNANIGERGGFWATVQAAGSLTNATFVSNESTAGSAAGLESESPSLEFVNNLVAFNEGGYGALRSSAAATWEYNDVAGNDLGEYGGAASDPTGLDGNLALSPGFVFFTPDAGTDDDLSLAPGSPLSDAGSPALLDLDSSISAIGSTGGPQTDCDLDGDGVHPFDDDCRPAEGDIFPGAYELEGGLDADCDGWGSLQVIDFVLDDGGLTVSQGAWEFADPTLLPGVGHQGVSAWCTACASAAPLGAVAELDLTVDLTALPAGTETRLELVHAFDHGAANGVATVQIFDGVAYDDVVTVNGSSDGWEVTAIDLTDEAGTSVDLRFHVDALDDSVPGWSIGRVEVQVIDADGDARAASLLDCDDDDPSIYDGAPELPYDGVDQDCDGTDLVDVDGDGFEGELAGGDDCDDADPSSFPGGVELPYDGVDQDCDGADLDDVDGDGVAATEAGGADCDDAEPTVYPAAPEVPYDGVDQDCDGSDLVDVDGDGYAGDEAPPFGDCDDADPDISPGEAELCGDGVDNDCDDAIDAVPDLDGDGFDVCAGDCDDADPLVFPGAFEACDGVDTDCDGVVGADELDADADGQRVCDGDCADDDPSVAAAFEELCDGFDNDCDEQIDEGHDLDGDGFSGCTTDCDDQRSAVYPGAPIDCQGTLDQDCDGEPDPLQEECLQTGCDCSSSLSGEPTPAASLASLFALLLLFGRRRRG